MEPESLSPHPKEPTTFPYPRPDQSSLQLSILFLEHPFEYYLPIYT
jgi:hypothetical protein